MLIKKYNNRRLYDTEESRYITLDELAQKIRQGKNVRVVDAKSNDDLTQFTLTQIILESRQAARLLPTPLLTQLVRMDDHALAEFFGRYMSWALEVYFQAKNGAQALAPFNPFATLPFMAGNALARLFTGNGPWNEPTPPPPAAAPPPPPDPEDLEPEPEPERAKEDKSDLAVLRREIDALKEALLKQKGPT